MSVTKPLFPTSPTPALRADPGTIAAQVIAIIAAQAQIPPSEITGDSTIESLGLDSLGLVETIFALEETFEISVPFNANGPTPGGFDISSVGAIIAAVEGLVAGRAA